MISPLMNLVVAYCWNFLVNGF